MKYGFLFGAGAEIAYKLPAGGGSLLLTFSDKIQLALSSDLRI